MAEIINKPSLKVVEELPNKLEKTFYIVPKDSNNFSLFLGNAQIFTQSDIKVDRSYTDVTIIPTSSEDDVPIYS